MNPYLVSPATIRSCNLKQRKRILCVAWLPHLQLLETDNGILNFLLTTLDTHSVGSVTGVMMPSSNELTCSSFKWVRFLKATWTFLWGCTNGLTDSSTFIKYSPSMHPKPSNTSLNSIQNPLFTHNTGCSLQIVIHRSCSFRASNFRHHRLAKVQFLTCLIT